MAHHVALNDLVGSVAGSIVDAQAQVERHFIEQVSRYFDKDGKPLCLAIKMPRAGGSSSENEADYNQIGVPLLSLVESSMLAIKDLRIDLDVELGSIVGGEDPEVVEAAVAPEMDNAMAAPMTAPEPVAAQVPPFVTAGAPIDVPQIGPVDPKPDTIGPERDMAPQPARAPSGGPKKMLTLGVGSRQDSGPRAQLTINVAATRPTEGMLRLITQLNKIV
uniref:DUF2589 domain-containing protein n=1 Tax=Parerythrobacter lutipelagi TaxID=1964208 RepID=UPI0010F7EAA0|nr:DUF2589 domain-containing protein [Parerythrobacter lutipelagi]